VNLSDSGRRKSDLLPAECGFASGGIDSGEIRLCFDLNFRLCITFGRFGRHALPACPHQSVSAATPRMPLVARSRRAASPTEVKRPRLVVERKTLTCALTCFLENVDKISRF